ncbi:laccase-2-like [Gossypium australe]|uniref:Laccase-2-like n=1 Tax=Gossypium australe TaxID=47621 RepID=A0A5B6V160_9ROSI|nr:laccase-2-like [Gossypium australe]
MATIQQHASDQATMQQHCLKQLTLLVTLLLPLLSFAANIFINVSSPVLNGVDYTYWKARMAVFNKFTDEKA